MRGFLRYTTREIEIIKKIAEMNGFQRDNYKDFLNMQIRKSFSTFPDIDIEFTPKKIRQKQLVQHLDFYIPNSELSDKIFFYSLLYNRAPSRMIGRIAIDPLLTAHLKEGLAVALTALPSQ